MDKRPTMTTTKQTSTAVRVSVIFFLTVGIASLVMAAVSFFIQVFK